MGRIYNCARTDIFITVPIELEPDGVCFSMQSGDGAPFNTDDCTGAQNQDHGLKKICASSRDIIDRLADTTHHQPSNKSWHACSWQRFNTKTSSPQIRETWISINLCYSRHFASWPGLPHPLCQSSQWGAIATQCLASDPGARWLWYWIIPKAATRQKFGK